MKKSNLNSVILLVAISFISILMVANSAGNMKLDIRISINLKFTAVVESHSPISIDGNDALAAFIEDEGLSGDGIYTSPYIIENFIIDADTAHGIWIQSTDAYLIIRNCTVEGGRTNEKTGIYLYDTANVKISDNLLSNNKRGIVLDYSSNNNILSGNNVNDNDYGIDLDYSSNNILIGNTASYNNYNGIELEYSSNNTLSGNIVSYNNDRGIFLVDSCNNTLSGNTASYNNDYGIYLLNSGIVLVSSSNNNILIGNTARYNHGFGIYLFFSSNNNILTKNTVSNNNGFGIYLYDSSNTNIIYFNDIYGNTHSQAFEESCTNNKWDNGTKGNYWGDDYINNYPSATNDGTIWNIPYEISGDGIGIDHFPIVNSITGDDTENTTTDDTESNTPGFSLIVAIFTSIFWLIRRRKMKKNN
ncbi:MAG: NosD domain-containing protein [Candidatus Hodarchaeales archaeon]